MITLMQIKHDLDMANERIAHLNKLANPNNTDVPVSIKSLFQARLVHWRSYRAALESLQAERAHLRPMAYEGTEI